MTENRIATRREAAEILRYSERTIDKMARDGRLKSFRVKGGGVRFWLRDLNALLGA